MSALIDNLGIWVSLGTIQPWWDWISFPIAFSNGSNIFRVSFQGDFNQIFTFLYGRVVYQASDGNTVDSKWARIYPNADKQILNFDINPILQGDTAKVIQVRKSSRWYGYKRPISDSLYTVSIEAFIPFPETINNINNLPQLQTAINQELAQLATELNVNITANILNAVTASQQTINSQYNVIISMLSGGI